jgi:hypothetical protein
MSVETLDKVWGSTQISNLFDVKDRIVVVTGGARGIGLMISQGKLCLFMNLTLSCRVYRKWSQSDYRFKKHKNM